MTYAPDLLEKAKAYGSATVHEAAGRTGALPSLIKPVDPAWRLAGPAFTVHGPPGDNLWIHRAIYSASPGDVLVVSTSGGLEWGYWGDIMNTAAVERGLSGMVIEGGVRDSIGLKAMGFPVFSAGLCIRGTGKDHDAVAFLGRPIRIGDVTVSTGDLVVADADGVAVVARAEVPKVMEQAAAWVAKEDDVIARLKRGERTLDIYGWGEG